MPESRLKRPDKTASFKEYITYYMQRKNLSQSQLARCALLNQSQVNKIVNERIMNIPVDTLVCLCLALQLSVAEAEDLLSRAERAFSPASAQHRGYLELIHLFSNLKFDCDHGEQMLYTADNFLVERGLAALPNADSH